MIFIRTLVVNLDSRWFSKLTIHKITLSRLIDKFDWFTISNFQILLGQPYCVTHQSCCSVSICGWVGLIFLNLIKRWCSVESVVISAQLFGIDLKVFFIDNSIYFNSVFIRCRVFVFSLVIRFCFYLTAPAVNLLSLLRLTHSPCLVYFTFSVCKLYCVKILRSLI